jgi:hypothetical protein
MIHKIKMWWHRKGHHSYEVPISLEEEENYRIEGKGSVKSEVSISYYTKKRCLYCNRRKLIHRKTVVTRTGRGSDWI